MSTLERALGLGTALQTTKRARDILAVLVRHGFEEWVHESGLGQLFERGLEMFGRERPAEGVKHLPVPERVRLALQELGPTFVKAGQILSTRPDIVPREWADELGKLRSGLPAVPWEEIEEVLAETFPQGVDAVFRSVEHTALSAASVAQVHRAVLADGTPVVVKVLRPGIHEVVRGDLELMRMLARLIERTKLALAMDPPEVVEQFAREFDRELDLRIEGRSTERMRRDFEDDPDVSFPAVYWRATGHQVLALEEIHGTLLAELDPETLTVEQRERIVERGARVVFRQCLDLGFFHADPHPGNLFVLPGERLCLIDCGMTGRLDPTTAEQLAELLHATVRQDLERVVRVSLALTDADPGLRHDRRFRNDVWRLLSDLAGQSMAELQLGRALQDFFDILREHGVRLPSDLVHLVKSIATIESVASDLAPSFDLVAHVRPHVDKLVRRRVGFRALRRRVEGGMFAYGQLLEELPANLRELFATLQSKRMSINVEHQNLDPLSTTIDRASRHIAFAVIVASLFLSSSVLMLADSMRDSATWVSTAAKLTLAIAATMLLLRVLSQQWKRRAHRRRLRARRR